MFIIQPIYNKGKPLPPNIVIKNACNFLNCEGRINKKFYTKIFILKFIAIYQMIILQIARFYWSLRE